MQIRFTLNKILLFTLLIFPITTIFQGLPGFNPLNRLLTVGIIILMICGFVLEPIKIIDIFYLFFGIALSIICIIYTVRKNTNVTITSFVFWVIFLCYIANNYKALMDELVSNLGLLLGITFFWQLTVFASFFFSTSYEIKWGGRYFRSFSNSIHRFAMTCFVVFAYAAIILILTESKKYILLFVIPTIGLLLSGARTYLVIGMLFIIGVYYVMCKNKIIFFASIIPIILLGILLIMLSPSGDKIVDTFEGNGYFGYMATLTSGRSIFWVEDIKGFLVLPFWKKLVGNGASYVYELNYYGTIKAYIWAHNDVINILCTNGIFGVVLYFSVFFSFIHRNVRLNKKGVFIPLFSFFFSLGFNAMFNMLYTYTSVVIGIPFMLFALYTLPNDIEYYRSCVNSKYLKER